MAEEDTCRTGIPAVAVLAVALILLPATTADASCSAGNRVDYRDAECLSAWWKNRGLLKKSPYHVRNMCPEYGKVVAKVDLKSAMDRTLHLNDGLPRDGDTRHRIRGVSCCSDIGDVATWVNTTLGNIKCAITGTYRKLGPDHAGRYLASFAWRYNRRYQLEPHDPAFRP